MSGYDESDEYDGTLDDLMASISEGDILSVDGVGDIRNEFGEYEWMNIILVDAETGQEFIFHLEGDELSQDILDEIADYAEDQDAYVNPAYGLGE